MVSGRGIEIQMHFRYFLGNFDIIFGCSLLMWGKNSGENGSVVRRREFSNNAQKRRVLEDLFNVWWF